MKTTTKRVKIGDTFRSAYADGNCLWKVLKSMGRGVWLCEIQNEPFEHNGKMYDSDYTGTQKTFMSREISAQNDWDDFLGELHNQHENFYKNLTLGQTIHYNNGHDNWVRCEVVERDNKKVLLPFALVGEWREYDLPHRLSDGTIAYSYYAKQIAEQETMEPNASNLFEAGCKPRNGINPNTLPAIDLTLPPMTPEQQETAKLWERVYQLQDTLKGNDPAEMLKKIAEQVQQQAE